MKKTTTKKVRTPEQIMQANLRKVMRGARARVGEKQELWLEFFQDTVNVLLSREDKTTPYMIVFNAGELADLMLSRYEDRWMQNS